LKPRATRRELLAGTLAGAGAAAGLSALAVPAPAAADVPVLTQPQVVADALEIERLMVLAYRRVLTSPTITPSVRHTLTVHLAHEQEHLTAVAAHAADLGLPAPTSPLDIATAKALMTKHHVSGGLVHLPPTEGECLVLLVDLESVAEGVYFNGLRDLTNPALIRLAAQVMSCEAQHWTVLMGVVNPGVIVKAVPWPFVLGSS
jgi:hypothetical protein